MALIPEHGMDRRMAGIRFKFILALTVVAVSGLVCPVVPQSPQQRVKLPEAIRRLSMSMPYHICTRTVDNIWKCISSSSSKSNNMITPNEPETELSSTTPPPVPLSTTEGSNTTSIGADEEIGGDGGTGQGQGDGNIGGVNGNDRIGRTGLDDTEISNVNETNYDSDSDTDTTVGNIPSVGTTISNCPPIAPTATTIPIIPDQDPIQNSSSSFMEYETATATEMSDIPVDQNLPITSTSASTTVSDDLLPNSSKPSGLIFQDNFDRFDMETWKHQITMSGGGNWEFQIYANNRSNSFVKDGMLHIRPTLTAELFDEEFLYAGTLNIYGGTPSDHCTNNEFSGCERTGNETNILNPVISARIQTTPFSFRYGRIVVRAKLPSGDWVRPDITLLPLTHQYGKGLASGKICIVEARGNKNLTRNGESMGIDKAFSSIEFGPFIPFQKKVEVSSSSLEGFDQDFHTFELEWRSNFMRFSTDGIETRRIEPPEGGFWNLTTVNLGDDVSNPWENAENRNMAPFDQKFYISLGLAVGGTTGFFPDDLQAEYPKPWTDTSSTAYKDFWENRFYWLPSWENTSFTIDSIEVYE